MIQADVSDPVPLVDAQIREQSRGGQNILGKILKSDEAPSKVSALAVGVISARRINICPMPIPVN